MAKQRVIKKIFTDADAEEEVSTIINKVTTTTGRDAFKVLTSGRATRDELIDKLTKAIGDSNARINTYVDTGLSVVGRSRIADTAKDLGLVWYRYIGGVITTTREFCEERDGEYYHEDEIKEWASEDWDGKIDGTTEDTIFAYCGGWNCRHDLIPVHESAVPKEYLN